MKLLQQLVQLITPHQIGKQKVLSSTPRKDTKLGLLYSGLQNGKIKSSDDALNVVFKKAKNGKRDLAKLKHDLKKQLLNNILLYEFDSKKQAPHDRRPAFFEIVRNFVTSYFLIQLNNRNIGIHMLEQKIEAAIDQEFSWLVIESARRLRQHYALINKDLEKSEQYDQLVQEWQDKYFAEVKIEGLYSSLVSNFNNSIPSNDLIQQLSKRYYKEAKRVLIADPTSSMIFRFSMIEIIMYESLRQPEKVIAVCEATIEQLQSKTCVDRAGIITIFFQQMNSLIEIGNYEQLHQSINTAFQYATVGQFNWFKLKKFQFQAFVYSQDYAAAFDVYNTVMQYQKHLAKNQILNEEWKLIALAVALLYKLGKIPEELYSTIPNIKAAKILNEFSVANKNKKGYNIQIIFFQLLHFVVLHKRDEAEAQIHAISAYKRRYLNGAGFERVNLFVRMMNQLILHWYDLSGIGEYSSMQLKKMAALSKENMSMELIPLEDIWKYLLESLYSATSATISDAQVE